MSDQNSATKDRAAADQILDGMNDGGLQNDPAATLRDAGVDPETSGGGDDVSGYALPIVAPLTTGLGGPEPPAPTPPYEIDPEKKGPGGNITDPPYYEPEPVPPGSGGTGTDDTAATW